MDASGRVRAKIFGSIAVSCRASRRARVDWRRSARDDISTCASRNGKPRIPCGSGPTARPRWRFRSALAQESKLDRALVITFALAEVLVQAGERVGIPGLMRPTGSRNVLDKMANAIVHDVSERPACRRRLRPSSLAEIVVVSDFWSPIGEVCATLANLSVHRRAWPLPCRSSIPRRKRFPIPAAWNSSSPKARGSITAGRAEAWKAEYESRVGRHRAAIRAETDRLGWSFTIHRTDVPATELLLALHARLGAPPAGRSQRAAARRPHTARALR